MAKSIFESGRKPAELKRIFRLHPPTKGFRKSIKAHYPKGALGNWGDKINGLLIRMI
jgi:large subunit ribosomal protein L30